MLKTGMELTGKIIQKQQEEQHIVVIIVVFMILFSIRSLFIASNLVDARGVRVLHIMDGGVMRMVAHTIIIIIIIIPFTATN